MQVLIDRTTNASATGSEVTDARLEELYATPDSPWLRVNFVSTVDGAATGADGRSGSINNAADKRVFDLLRRQADAIVIGAGTAATEGYRPVEKPLVVVTNRGRVPETLVGAEEGAVLVATHAASPGLADLRDTLGDDQVLVTGAETVDLAALRRELRDRGFDQLLSEGGPTLFAEMLAQHVVDELCLTTAPHLIAGEHTRITHGMPAEVGIGLQVLLEEDDSLLGRWLVAPPAD